MPRSIHRPPMLSGYLCLLPTAPSCKLNSMPRLLPVLPLLLCRAWAARKSKSSSCEIHRAAPTAAGSTTPLQCANGQSIITAWVMQMFDSNAYPHATVRVFRFDISRVYNFMYEDKQRALFWKHGPPLAATIGYRGLECRGETSAILLRRLVWRHLEPSLKSSHMD